MYENVYFSTYFLFELLNKLNKMDKREARGANRNNDEPIRLHNEELGKCRRAYEMGQKASKASKILFIAGIAVYAVGVACNLYCDRKYQQYQEKRKKYYLNE
jgi:hypothetical protein